MRGETVKLDCEKKDCIYYGGLGCHGSDDPMNQTCCRLDLSKATKCLNGLDYPMCETLDDMSVDDYVKYLKMKWPMDDVIEVDGHPILQEAKS